jgi:hypothetical protein
MKPNFWHGEVEKAVARERERCAALVPTTWLDPLLSGPAKVVPTGADGGAIEALLQAIAARIRDVQPLLPAASQQKD